LADQEISLSNYLLAEVEDLEMSTPLYTKILKIYREALAKGEVPSVDYFIGFGDNEIQKEVIDLVTMRHEFLFIGKTSIRSSSIKNLMICLSQAIKAFCDLRRKWSVR